MRVQLTQTRFSKLQSLLSLGHIVPLLLQSGQLALKDGQLLDGIVWPHVSLANTIHTSGHLR